MVSLLHFIPGCYAIRVYGRRWLKLTPPPAQGRLANGWRAVSWTPKLADAENFPTRNVADLFAGTLHCPCEIIDVNAWTGMTPDTA